MDEPVAAGRFPHVEELETGTYYWCACGRSMTQPYCDGAHKGAGFSPVEFRWKRPEKTRPLPLQEDRQRPLCDGSHRSL